MQDPHSEEKIPSISHHVGIKQAPAHDEFAGIIQSVRKSPHHFRSQDLGSNTAKGLEKEHHSTGGSGLPQSLVLRSHLLSVQCFQEDAKPKRPGTAAAGAG